MSRVVIQSTREGLPVPREILEQAGVEPGSIVEIDLAPLPTAGEIQHRALRHTVWKPGDAIHVAWPRREDEEGLVELLPVGGEGPIGRLYYSAYGQLAGARAARRPGFDSRAASS